MFTDDTMLNIVGNYIDYMFETANVLFYKYNYKECLIIIILL